MNSPPIRFSTDILRRLGEELNPNLDQGILELVKNSYDANARRCAVRFRNVINPGGEIEIDDDGDGLEYQDIVEGWLVLGRSRKNTSKGTRLGRTPAGDKGLGRLAALRLGKQVHLITRPRESADVEYLVTIDWDRYKSEDLVENVPVNIDERPRSQPDPGTTVIIDGVRNIIGRMEVKRLARALILLADPFDRDPSAFKPTLESPDFKDLEQLVDRMYFDDAEYHLVASLSDGRVSARVTDWRGRTLFEGDHKDIAPERNGKKYSAPDASFDLWAFILTRTGFETRSTSVAEVRSWIESFGGVHLYLNGLRVAPYGNPANDWLDMNLRRVQNPEERPSTNNSIGRVSISDTDGLLSQKTDRSGFIENHEFEELRAFAQDALEWMARRRLSAAEARRRKERAATPTRSEQSRDSLKRQIERAPANIKNELTTAFTNYDREHQRETDALRREVQLYRTLSTAGITAATFAHESGGYPLKIIAQSVTAIEFRGMKYYSDTYEKHLANPVASIRHACDSLGVLSSATLQLVDSDKRRMGRIDLNVVVRQVLSTFSPLLDGRDVKVIADLSPVEPYLRGTEAAVESIITNFINNSLTAFESSPDAQRIVKVKTDVIGDTWRMEFSDNGPGISGIDIKDVWLPGNTTRASGTGLGLTIVRDAVADLNGRVNAMPHSELGGATFSVEVPILGVS